MMNWLYEFFWPTDAKLKQEIINEVVKILNGNLQKTLDKVNEDIHRNIDAMEKWRQEINKTQNLAYSRNAAFQDRMLKFLEAGCPTHGAEENQPGPPTK